jgi:putative oxidoreductase
MTDAASWVFLAGRILFAAFFVNSSIAHVRFGGGMVGYAKQARFPLPRLAGWPAGLWLAAGSLSVILGAWADVGALMLALFVVLAAAGFHRFWKFEGEQRQTQRSNFLRNVAFLGAALALFAFFATAGHDLPLTLTDPLIDLR